MLSNQIDALAHEDTVPAALLLGEWRIPVEAPGWIRNAIERVSGPMAGSYSFVYSLQCDRVLKLVSEEGALRYLRFCQGLNGALKHFPRVFDMPDCTLYNVRTGSYYHPVVMERLAFDEDAAMDFSHQFCCQVWQTEPQLKGKKVLHSEAALTGLSQALRSEHRSLSSSLLLLAEECRRWDWVADLAPQSNWMQRGDGTTVLSDPVHHVDNYSYDLV